MIDPFEAHYRMVLKALVEGRVVPLLGAGINLFRRTPGIPWQRGQDLPSGRELAAYLAESYNYPTDDVQDLVRVSQYVAIQTGWGPLYDELHRLFDVDYQPTPLHSFFAILPGILRSKGYKYQYQVIVTTNYDDVLEREFNRIGEPYDLVSYIAKGEDRGKFMHCLPDGEQRLIEKPNEYRGLSFDQRSVILKIHGAIDRTDPDKDSFVITEDDYIDYLTRTDLSNLIPVPLPAKLKRSHFLFLGYGLRDWNLRVILHRIWGQQKLNYKSWAIQKDPAELDQKFWLKRDVDILDIDLETYIAVLGQKLESLLPAGGGV